MIRRLITTPGLFGIIKTVTMGIFDKVKSFTKKLTGGSAKVFVEADPIKFGEPFEVRIKAIIQDEPINIDRVYLNVVGLEEVQVADVDTHQNSSGKARSRVEHVHRTFETYVNELNVTGQMNLVASMTYDWKIEVTIPETAPPIYLGKFARHTYSVRAGLDMAGNDPDSGWVELK